MNMSRIIGVAAFVSGLWLVAAPGFSQEAQTSDDAAKAENESAPSGPVSFIRKRSEADAKPKSEKEAEEAIENIDKGDNSDPLEQAIETYEKNVDVNDAKDQPRIRAARTKKLETENALGLPSRHQTLLDADSAEIVDQVSQAVRKLKSVQGRFVQTSINGPTLQGDFYLKRPGRIRFEYDEAPYKVVADGTRLAIYDEELDTADLLPLVSTPLHFLLKKKWIYAATLS